MGWFDEQIKQRLRHDQETVEDSFFRLASVVMDKWSAAHLRDERLIAREAVGDILKYYHLRPVEIPDEIHGLPDQLEFAMRPSGLMVRDVYLDEGWQRDAYGPMLGRLKDGGQLVALLPRALSGYWFKDPDTGKPTKVNRKTAARLEREAICFYQPLPMKKLGIPDLLLHMKKSITRGDIALIVMMTLLATLVGKIEPRVYEAIVGPVLKDRRVSLLIGMAVFLLSSAFAAQLLNMVRNLVMNRINTKTSLAVESSVMMRLLSLPVSFFRKFSSGELSSRAESVGSLCTMLVENILSVGLGSTMSLLYITDILHYAPALVLPSLAIILSTVLIGLAATFMQVDISRRKMKLAAEEAGMSYAVLNGIQKIRLSGAEKRVFARWGRLYAKGAQLEYNPPRFVKLNGVLVTAITLGGTVILYYLAVKTGVSESQYYAFSAAFGRVSGAFTALASIATAIADIPPILEMAEPILKAEPEVAEDRERAGKISGGVELSHVSFRYDENTPFVLNDLSVKIRAGEYVAIVGRTGCGKSTLVRLLLGFETPERGAVYYDGHDLNSIDPRTLRRQIGCVIQNGQLFQGDIFSNITISAPQLSLEEAWAAAETAGIAQDIREMPMGMNTVLSEGQGGISGGQKQRLMIARAIAPKPRILILDEATSALDNRTQKQVSDALDKLKCTRIVIAHRLSTIRNCDRILVMSDGAIIEEGTYKALIEKNGAFADLVARQRLEDLD